MLWLRFLSALIGIPALIWVIIKGDWLLAVLVAALVIIGTIEFRKMLKIKGFKTFLGPIILGEMLIIAGAWQQSHLWLELGIGLGLISILLITLANYPEIRIEDIAANFFVLIYVGWSLAHIILLRTLDNGIHLVVYLFVVIWSTDTGAYFAGRFFGKNKLAPIISPNKTKEGALGGLLTSLLAAIIYNWIFPILQLPLLLCSTILISVLGQIGDLVESAFKRMTGVKDSGQIIPGHGGILDRFDSTILTAPVLYYLLFFLNR
ncbi:MAG: phosphatidate cytidylyltransferase [Clostridia bacterium]|nr:phosphatidate cytidylyltransferase [Clostridia bacterium]